MGFDLIGWSEAAPGTGTVGITAPQDDIYTTVGDGIMIKPRAPYLLLVSYTAESTPGYVRFDSPTLQKGGRRYTFIRSVDLNDVDPAGGITDMRHRPLELAPGEYLEPKSNNATDEDTLIGAMVGDGYWPQSRLEGLTPTHRIRGYADQALTANAWTTCAITWDQSLEAGRYYIVGFIAGSYKASGVGLVLARLILGESNWRPGVPALQATGDKLVVDAISEHAWSKWPIMQGIELQHHSMPDVECLSPMANTDLVVELELIKQ